RKVKHKTKKLTKQTYLPRKQETSGNTRIVIGNALAKGNHNRQERLWIIKEKFF
ncbi:8760_t:CDS:1, partial [Cetraspora pellucida]